MIAGPRLNTNSKAFLRNMPFIILVHFLYSSFTALQPHLSLYHSHTHTVALAAVPTCLPGVCAAVREVVLDSQLQLGEQTVGERERESMASLQTQKHSSRMLITTSISAISCYLHFSALFMVIHYWLCLADVRKKKNHDPMARQCNLKVHSEMSKTEKSQKRKKNSSKCCHLEHKFYLSAQNLSD